MLLHSRSYRYVIDLFDVEVQMDPAQDLAPYGKAISRRNVFG
jgi:hypothetical protein